MKYCFVVRQIRCRKFRFVFPVYVISIFFLSLILSPLQEVKAKTDFSVKTATTKPDSVVKPHNLPGFKNYMMLGVNGDNSSASENWLQSTAPWDLRYQYLVGDVNNQNNNWAGWNSPAGEFATYFMNDSSRLNTIPVLTYYCLLDSPYGGDERTSDFLHINTPATMHNYFANFKLLLDKVNAFGKPAIIQIEPDFWGFMEVTARNSFSNDDATRLTASVSSSGYGDVVNGLPDTIAGFAQALVHLRDKYAPNALLGYHNSNWGTLVDVGLNTDPNVNLQSVAQHSANFYQSLNANFDLIFDDMSDRDAAYYAQWDGGAHWWDTKNQSLPNFSQYAKYLSYLHQYTQKPLVEWQIPIGNTIMRSSNNTKNHWQDNKVQYFLGSNYAQTLTDYANAGVVALLFGSGNGDTTDFMDYAGDGVTNPAPINGNNTTATVSDDDGGYLRQQAANYYKSPYPLPGTAPVTGCKVNCNNRYSLPLVANQFDNTTTYLTLQNMGGAPANVTVQYYDSNSGSNGTQDNRLLPAKGQSAFLPNLSVGQKATGIISSDQPLNVLLSESVATGGSAFNISSQASSTLYDPIATNNYLGFNTSLTVFNSGDTASDISIEFYDQSGNIVGSATQNLSLPSHSSMTFNQAGSNLSSAQSYWAKISGSGGSQLVAQITETNPGIQFTATLNATTQLSSTLYAPAVFKGAFGFNTGLAVANPNSSSASISVNYYDTGGNKVFTQDANVAANGIWSVYQGGLAGLPANFNGSATITSSQPVLAVVNENGGGSKSGSYTPLNKGSQTVGLPVMAAGAFGGYFTGTTLLNVSNNTVNITFQYVNSYGGDAGSKTFSISPNASFQLYQGNTNSSAGLVLPNGFFGTAQVSSNSPDSLVATTNAINGSLFYTYSEPSS